MDVIAKARAAAHAAGQKLTALATYVALMGARAGAAKRPIQIGPGKRSVLSMHRRMLTSKSYPNVRPFSHPRREAAATKLLNGGSGKPSGIGYMGLRNGESLRYHKRTGRLRVFAAPGRDL